MAKCKEFSLLGVVSNMCGTVEKSLYEIYAVCDQSAVSRYCGSASAAGLCMLRNF